MQNENRSSLYWQSEYLYLEQGCSLQIRKPGALLLTPLCKWCFVASCEAGRLVCFVFPSILLFVILPEGREVSTFFGHHIPNLFSNSPPISTHPPSPPAQPPYRPHLPCLWIADKSRRSVRFVVQHGDCVYSQVYSQLWVCVSVCVQNSL